MALPDWFWDEDEPPCLADQVKAFIDKLRAETQRISLPVKLNPCGGISLESPEPCAIQSYGLTGLLGNPFAYFNPFVVQTAPDPPDFKYQSNTLFTIHYDAAVTLIPIKTLPDPLLSMSVT